MITTEEARYWFDYKDGHLYWRVKPNRCIPRGSVAGRVGTNGYWVVTLNGKKIPGHRLIWTWHGRELSEQIDHINRDPLDNRIENLRAADYFTNACNSKIKADNKSGIKGVSWCNTYKKWVVQMYWMGKKTSGRFNTIEEAKAFADSKRRELHGEFANDGVR